MQLICPLFLSSIAAQTAIKKTNTLTPSLGGNGLNADHQELMLNSGESQESSALDVDSATCKLDALQELKPQLEAGLEGSAKILVDLREFDSQVAVRMSANTDGLKINLPGFPRMFGIPYKDISLPLLTYYDRCLQLELRTMEVLLLCFDCHGHRNLWFNSITERVLFDRIGARGNLPVWPQEIRLTQVANQEQHESSEPLPPTNATDVKSTAEEEDKNIYVHILAYKGLEPPEMILGGIDLSTYIKQAVAVVASTTVAPSLTADLSLSPIELAQKKKQQEVEQTIDLLEAMNNRLDLETAAEEPEVDADIQKASEVATQLLRIP
ncbi:hypothetical protein GNI_023820 [Gregarina niphandrodes]|uniref:Uncharacterized protein n=1 Tax=Gregarina niphandrodes TaxID=110365 RepID=A0A023BBJ6_GRENI|nr:hypothetical protein GNI_023820 [Gregarina niphandrodes]EZG79922.1 hypothetical protein GNI_023820 [Gregarina niphandrodes]|eukprot:XP_011134367.1 hypothetical protein GNI_023820 [Gregarina niphandrodes]